MTLDTLVPMNLLEQELPFNSTVAEDLLLVTSQRSAAAAYVSLKISAPVVDRTEVCRVARPVDAGAPVALNVVWGKGVDSVAFWARSGALREEPGGAIPVNTLGRIVLLERSVIVYPPVGGWPEVLAGSYLQFVVSVGMADDHEFVDNARQAIVQKTRAAWRGVEEESTKSVVRALLAPMRYLGD